jgi:uncharacterized membrane protein
MALLICQDCGQPVSVAAEISPQCGRRTESSEASASCVRQVGSVMQMLGGLVILIGVGILLLLWAPHLDIAETTAIWRGAILFVFLGIIVCMLGRLAGRAWRR